MLATISSFFQWFAGGEDTPYMQTIHCMRGDWFWVWATVALDATIIVGYVIIAFRWRQSAKLARKSESKSSLNAIMHIFLWCAVCGYGFNILRMWWPAVRLLDMEMAVLAFFTYKYILRSKGMRTVYERLDGAEKLASQLNQYTALAQSLPQLIWTAKPDGSHDFFNDKYLEYTGLSLEQMTDDWRKIEVHQDDLERCLQRWGHSLQTGEPYENEVRIRRHDGAYLWHLVRANPIKDADGHVQSWIGSATDINERKEAEAMLLKEAERRRFFMNALSHDLRTPLNSIVLNAQLASLGVNSGDVATATEAVSVIKENATAATAMLNSLLEFARISAFDKNVMEVCYLTDILVPILRRFDKAAEQKGVTLKGPEGISGIRVTTDRAKIDRILSNLVDNALKFTTKGFVAMETKTEGSDLTIFVTDTGFGVSPEHQSLLFGEFFQAGNYARDRQKGFGMGLAISRVLARQLGGDVKLVQSSSAGSRFAIVLKGCVCGTPETAPCVGS